MTQMQGGKVSPPGFPEQHIIDFFAKGLRRRSAVPGRGPFGLTDAQLAGITT